MNTYTTDNRHPCGALIDGDFVVIAIHKSAIQCATELHPDLEYYNEDDQFDCPKVTNLNRFVEEVVDALNNEREDGSTFITDALDKAIVEAIESGAEGVKYRDE